MKKANCLLVPCAAVSLLFVVACGEESSSSAPTGAIHTCETLPASEVSRIVGRQVTSADASVEMNDGPTAMSQCSYSFEGDAPIISVQIRRFPSKAPRSREADMESARQQDDSLGIGEDTAKAMASAKDINGLGDVAYEFEAEGFYRQLTAYWGGYYQVAILSMGGREEEGESAARRELAQYVMDHL